MESQASKRHATHVIDPVHDIRMEKQWEKYFDEAQKLIQEGSTTTITLVLYSLMGNNLKDFWRYNGSLTTPLCNETVIWTVFKEPIFILNYEFEAFSDKLFYESYRGPQPLYERRVLRSFPEEITSPIPEQNCCCQKSGSTNRFPMVCFMNITISIKSTQPTITCIPNDELDKLVKTDTADVLNIAQR
ncbi:unnamed protein product, partial [Rotaria sp. Silwood1]